MSVICQNFVQNTWKKDLCSNCFKSLADHGSPYEPKPISLSPLSLHSDKNGVISSLDSNTRYISQATTVYQSRSLLSHCHNTWKSLLSGQTTSSINPLRIENGFHGKSLNLSPTNDVLGKKENGDVKTPLNSLQVNGTASKGSDTSNESSGAKEEDGVQGILKKDIKRSRKDQRRANVGFKEEEPQVIGYGGRDYESDEADWDISSDDGDFCLESLDVTEEDRAISKITKENTEFNSDNANLLHSLDLNDTAKDDASKVETNEKNNEDAGTVNGILEVNSSKSKSVSSPPGCIKPDEGAEKSAHIETKNSNAEKACQRELGAEDEIKLTQFTSRDKEEQSYKRPSLWPSAESLSSGEQAKPSLLSDTQVTSTVIKERIAEGSVSSNQGSPHTSEQPPSTSKCAPTADKQSSSLAKTQWCQPKEVTIISSSPNNATLPQKEKQEEVPSDKQASNDSGKRSATYSSLTTKQGASTSSSKTSAEVPSQNANSASQNVNSGSMPLSSRYRKLDITPRSSFLHGLSAKESDNSRSSPSAIYSPGSDLFVSSNSPGTSAISNNTTEQSVSSTKPPAPAIPSEDKQDKAVSNSSVAKDSNSSSPNSERQNWRPKVPSKPAVPNTPPPAEDTSSISSTDKPRIKDDALHYAVGRTVVNPESGSNTPPTRCPESNHYAESNIYQEIGNVNGSSPSPQASRTDSGVKRENKLAALALELEQARCGTGSTKRQAPAPPPPPNPPEQSLKSSSFQASSEQVSRPSSLISNSTTISSLSINETKSQSVVKSKLNETPTHYGRPKSSSLTSMSPGSFKSRIPLIGDDSYKSKRGKFSLKKFLKLGKDSDSLDVPNTLTPNPKAWKMHNEFDRSKGKIEIIHPMDMVAKSPSSDNLSSFVKEDILQENGKESPLDENQRRRSASSSDLFTYISGSIQSSSISDKEEPYDPNGEDLYDDTLPEDFHDVKSPEENEQTSNPSEEAIQKSPDPKLKTPPTTSTTQLSSTSPSVPQHPPVPPPPSGTSSSGVRPSRPPKPPPPPRTRSVLPNGPHGGSKDDQDSNASSSPKVSNAAEDGVNLPSRRPAPKRCTARPPSMRSDYANLGDIRNPMAPKKPERSPSVGNARKLEENGRISDDSENVYEPIEDGDYHTLEDEHIYYAPPEEIADRGIYPGANYGVYDECQHHHSEHVSSKNTKNNRDENSQSRQQGYVVFQSPAQNQNKSTENSLSKKNQKQQQSDTRRKSITGDPCSQDPNKEPPSHERDGYSDIQYESRPWETLEDSYAAVVEASHEVFAKVLEQVLQEKALQLSKPDGIMLRWTDFDLESSEPTVILGNKVVYNAVFKYEPKLQVTLLVVPHCLPNSSNKKFLRSILLGWFVDQLPMSFIQLGVSHYFEATQATVYVLKRCKIQTLSNYYEKGPSLLADQRNLKEISFIVLQLIHALKIAQANGTEEVDSSPNSMIVVKAELDNISYLISDELDTPLEKRGSMYKASTPDVVKTSLCQYAVMTLLHLLKMDKLDDLMSHARNSRLSSSSISLKTFAALAQVLSQEKASSLSQAKSLLEYLLWGPQQILQKMDKKTENGEMVLQRWLDVERARCLKSLTLALGQVKSTISGEGINVLTTFQEFHYLFLLRTNARALKETALLADFNFHF